MKRFLLTTAVLCLALTCLALPALAEGVTYYDADGVKQTCESYTVLAEDFTAWEDGWYVAKGRE